MQVPCARCMPTTRRYVCRTVLRLAPSAISVMFSMAVRVMANDAACSGASAASCSSKLPAPDALVEGRGGQRRRCRGQLAYYSWLGLAAVLPAPSTCSQPQLRRTPVTERSASM